MSIMDLLSDCGQNDRNDQLLTCPPRLVDKWLPIRARQSVYQTILAKAWLWIEASGDWDWLNDVLNGKVISAAEALEMAQG